MRLVFVAVALLISAACGVGSGTRVDPRSADEILAATEIRLLPDHGAPVLRAGRDASLLRVEGWAVDAPEVAVYAHVIGATWVDTGEAAALPGPGADVQLAVTQRTVLTMVSERRPLMLDVAWRGVLLDRNGYLHQGPERIRRYCIRD